MSLPRKTCRGIFVAAAGVRPRTFFSTGRCITLHEVLYPTLFKQEEVYVPEESVPSLLEDGTVVEVYMDGSTACNEGIVAA